MPVGFTDAHKIGDYLGRTLSAEQYAQATQLVPAVEAYIERRTGRSWLGTSPTTDELHVLEGNYLYLRNRPVTAVSSITLRVSPTDDDESFASSDWLLEDATTGKVYVGTSHWGWEARVTYTHAGPALPEDLALAATMLGAYWLAPTLDTSESATDVDPNIKRYSVGQDLTVEYFDRVTASEQAGGDVPTSIRALIDGHRSRERVFA